MVNVIGNSRKKKYIKLEKDDPDPNKVYLFMGKVFSGRFLIWFKREYLGGRITPGWFNKQWEKQETDLFKNRLILNEKMRLWFYDNEILLMDVWGTIYKTWIGDFSSISQKQAYSLIESEVKELLKNNRVLQEEGFNVTIGEDE